MVAKAVSAEFGVSKNAAVTIVRLPEPILTATEALTGKGAEDFLRYSTILDAFRLVLADIKTKKIEYRAVINLSGGWLATGRLPQPGDIEWEFYQVLKDLVANYAIIVASAGNFGSFTPMDPSQPLSLVSTAKLILILSHEYLIWFPIEQPTFKSRCKDHYCSPGSLA